MFAALAEHLSTALIALYVDATHRTLFNHCISISAAQSTAEMTDRACLCKVRGRVMNDKRLFVHVEMGHTDLSADGAISGWCWEQE